MNKAKDFQGEKLRVRQYLEVNTATAAQVSIELGIWRPNMCRHKKQLQDAGLLIEIGKGKCPVTNFKASYLTCNEFLIAQHKSQLPQLSFTL